MKLAIVALCVAAATANTYFNEGDAPTCQVINGATVVFYSDSLASHASWKCSHGDSGCTCAAHPTHAVGGCREFDHTDATNHKIGGDCDDQCTGVTCQNGGQCVDGDGTYTCSCATGYEGAHCETNTDDCANNSQCLNGATCVDGVDTFTCTCAAGFEGAQCETNTDDCANNSQCLNGATCVDGVDTFTCTCATGFEGDRCQTDIDECATNNGGCGDAASFACTNTVGGFTCANIDPSPDTCTVWRKIQTLPSSGLTNFVAPASNSPTGVYKITNNNGQALFIKDNNPAWNGYDWQSNSPSAVKCATSDSPSWNGVTAAISCNSKGVGTHTCGYGNGWIMFHNGETYGSNNPCKIGQTTSNGYGRGQFVNVYSCDSF